MTEQTPLNCEQALARVFEFIDHELKPHEREAMREHLHTCKSCFSRAEFERRLKGKLKELREETDPAAQDRIEKLFKSW